MEDFFANGETILTSWIELLVNSFDIFADFYIEEVEKVRQLLTSTSLFAERVLEYVVFAYSRLSDSSLFDHFFVIGAELAEEQFIKGLCDVASQAAHCFAAQDIVKAIIAASASLIEFLSHLFFDDDEAVLNKSNIYFRAMQFHNIFVSDGILTDLRSHNFLFDFDFVNLLVRALCIAYEYGDSNTATALQILAHDTSFFMIITIIEIATAFHIAVYTDNVAAIFNFLDLGVLVEAYLFTDNTPLLFAAQLGFTSLVHTLFTEGAADANAKEAFCFICLHFAAQNNFVNIVSLLIDAKGKKASVMTCNNVEDTPIVVAVRNGHVKIAKMLLKTHFQNPEICVDEKTENERE